MTVGHASPGEILVSIDQTASGQYKIQTGHLEQIGKQLRGKQSFSVFYSIVLPLLVTLLTMTMTGLFQWISWTNSIRLQDATESWTKAAETHERVAAAMGKRRYATLVFIPTIRDLSAPVRRQQIVDATTDGSARLAPPEQPRPGDAITVLQKLQHQLWEQRHDTYFSSVRTWNETYDQMITDIEYNLDRQVLLSIERRSVPMRELIPKLKKIDCDHSLPGQLDELALFRHSLKVQFAALQHCYMELNVMLSRMLANPTAIDAQTITAVNDRLADLYTMGNEFRCYAQRRVDFYRRQKERSLISPGLVWRQMFRTERQRVERHFANTETRCSPTERAA